MARPARSRQEVAEISDEALVGRALEGDRSAEDALVRRYAALIANLAARLLGSRQDAEDLAHDALVDALSGLSRLREPAAFRAWLVRITVLRARSVLRRRRVARALGLDRTVPDEELAALASPDAATHVRAELALLDAALARASTDARLAWLLRHVEELELTEVAGALGCSLASAKRRIAEADAVIRRHAGGRR